MNLIKRRVVIVLIITAFCFLSTCGIEEFYYLPQVSEGWITTDFNLGASVTLPSTFLDSFYYASGYVIFYRIYLSTIPNGSKDDFSLINTTLASHYNFLYTYVNPTTSSSLDANTFRNRGYYELEIEGADISKTALSKNGGAFTINFPLVGDYPYILFNGTEYPLLRSTDNTKFTPEPNRYFLNTVEIRDSANASSEVNADVTAISGADYAYVSMYIAAIGRNQRNFSRIYGKPAYINVFLLTRDQ